MDRRTRPAGLQCSLLLALPIAVFSVAGCLDGQSGLLTPSFFGNAFGPQTPEVSSLPASEGAAKRVALVGQKILAANPQLAIRPIFATVGDTRPGILHRGTNEITITEGLVRQCGTEAQLAAVLCQEMGKMVAEREAQVGAQLRAANREPPPRLDVGHDNIGSAGAADKTYLAELALYDKQRPKAGAGPAATPDARALARTLMVQAGYSAADFDSAAPLLRVAEAPTSWDKQLGNPTPPRNWTQPTP
jgi:hypothetical protein